MFAVIFICGNLCLRIDGKIAKIAKIRTRKNFVQHGVWSRSGSYLEVPQFLEVQRDPLFHLCRLFHLYRLYRSSRLCLKGNPKFERIFISVFLFA